MVKKMMKNIINLYFLFSFLLLFLVIIFYFGKIFTIPNIFFLLIIILLIIPFPFLNQNKKINLFLLNFSVLSSLFFVEIISYKYYYSTDRQKFIIKNLLNSNFEWDNRTKGEFINFLQQKQNIGVYPHYSPNGWLSTNLLQKNEEIVKIRSDNKNLYPLSNISNSLIVHCNEYGKWQYFATDEFGFNNPLNQQIDEEDINIVLIGDSFVEGFCHGKNQDIGSLIRNKGYNVYNFGKAGGGIIHYNAIYNEYVLNNDHLNPDLIVLFVFFTNDVGDTYEEYNVDVYKNYSDLKYYNQDLINNQKYADNILKNIYKLVFNQEYLNSNTNLKNTIQNFGANIFINKNQIKKITILDLDLMKSLIKLRHLRLMIRSYFSFNDTVHINKDKKNLFFNELERFIQLIKEKNNVITVYLPSYSELKFNSKEHSNLFEQKMQQINIPNINMYEFFKKEKINDIFYSGLPGHYSVYGYEVLSNEIVRKIKEKKIDEKY